MSEPAENMEQEVTETEADPIEAIARKGGWAPKEEWRGDEEGWKDAATFVEEGIGIQKRQHEKIERLQSTVESVESNIRKMAEGEAKRTRKALESQKARLEAKRREAIEDMDTDKFDQLDKELRDTEQQLNSVEPETEDPVKKEFEDGEKSFRERNTWYGEDPAMTSAVLAAAQNMRGMFPDMNAEKYYEALEDVARAQFPDRFKNQNRSRAGAVAGDRPGGSNKKAKGFDSLPPEAQEAFNEISLYTSMSKDDYAKSYFDEQE